MDHLELHALKQWFSGYCRSFYTPEPADQKNILLKEEHTARVIVNMAEIAGRLGLNEHARSVAEVIALFHDVGRFPQYHQYRTFRDSLSVNHATLGARVLTEQDVLRGLSVSDRELVLRAVSLHNVFSLPAQLDEETLLFVKMIRDADKLDIWRVFIGYYELPGKDRPNAAGLGLPDTPDYSASELDSLGKGEMVHLTSLRTLNDFKLLQLAWIFDLNFARSLELVRERSYVDRLSSTLPGTPEIAAAVKTVREYVDRKICVR